MTAPAAHSPRPSRTRALLGLAIGCLWLLPADDVRAFGELDVSGYSEQLDTHASDDSLFDIGLPLSFRVRLDGAYTRNRYPSEGFSTLLRIARFGPAVRTPLAVESQVALTRAVGIEGLEIGVAWKSRNRLSDQSGLDFGRQFVGALIRFSH